METHIWGKSVHLNLNGCTAYVSDPEKIRQFVDELIVFIGMKKFGPLYLERFGYGDLEGYSCMQFIQTSSVTCHFDEQQGKSFRAFIDVFSCKDFDEQKVESFCKNYFEAEQSSMQVFIRK